MIRKPNHHVSCSFLFLFSSLVLLCVCGRGTCYADRLGEFAGEGLTFSLYSHQYSDCADNDEEFGYGRFSLSGSFKMHSSFTIEADGPRISGLYLKTGGSRIKADLPWGIGDTQIDNIDLTVSYMFGKLTGKKFLIAGGADACDEVGEWDDPDIRYKAFFIVFDRKKGDPLSMFYGAGYVHSFGRGLPIPFFGLNWKFREDWNFNMILPYSFSWMHTVNESFKMGFSLGFDGTKLRFANDNMFPGQGDDIDLFMWGLKTGYAVHYNASDKWTVSGNVNYVFYKHIELLHDNDDFIRDTIAPGFTAGVKIKYTFGGKK